MGRGVFLWLALSCAASAVFAQTGSLEVRVVATGSREPLAGATVAISSAIGLVAPTAVVADGEGRALFPVLRTGRGYALEVSMPGFAQQRVSDVTVRINSTERVEVQLTPEVTERVLVRVESGIVDLERTGNATRFDERFLQNLPVPGRTYQNILTLAPGVSDADGDGNPNVHGARDRDFQARVDGISNVDPLTGQWLNQVNPESIEEIEVIPSGAGVEFGRAQGGYARVVQKQGGNEFEGVFNFIVRSSKLDGAGAADGPAPEFDWLQPGLQVSGPIVPDRLWYRLSHEYVDRENPVNVLRGIELIERTQSLNADQITWQASPRNKLALQFQSDPLEVRNLDLSSAVPVESSRTLERGGDTWSLKWQAPYSPRLFVDTVAAYQDSYVDILPSDPAAEQDCMIFRTFVGMNRASCLDLDANRYSGPYPETSRDKRQRLTVQSTATWYVDRALGSSHRLRLGLAVENERYFRRLDRVPDFDFERTFNPFPPPVVTGLARARVPAPGTSTARATGTNWALFLEDQLRPTAGLSITLGLRVDREEIDSEGRSTLDPAAEAANFFALYAQGYNTRIAALRSFTAYEAIAQLFQLLGETLGVPTQLVPAGPAATESSFWPQARRAEDITRRLTNVSPRVAIAWDPWADGKTKIAASAGRYYDKIFLAVPLIELEAPIQPITFSGVPNGNEATPIYSQGILGAINPTLAVRTVDHELRTPYQDELHVGVERALGQETSIKASWMRREFRDQFQDVDINHTIAGFVYNPGWGEILQLGNYNTAEYEAWVLELVRRYYRGWEMNASYTRSEAIGDAEDYDLLLGNNLALQDQERGYLSYDQRHVFKLNAVALTRWGIRVGGSVRWESGLPYSVVLSRTFRFLTPPEYQNLGAPGLQSIYIYPSRQRNDQRNEAYWTFDAKLAREVRVGRERLLQFTLEVFNLMNDDTLVQGERLDGLASGTRRFGRQYQVGVRFQF